MSDVKRRAVSQLCFAEQILIWAARAWVTGRDGRTRVKAELARAFGEAEGQATAAALGGLLGVLNSAALRTLYLGPMACPHGVAGRRTAAGDNPLSARRPG